MTWRSSSEAASGTGRLWSVSRGCQQGVLGPGNARLQEKESERLLRLGQKS